jgi:hypothetical protein
MKPSSLLLTLIIPGPSYPGKNFHVFMEPVYEELAELFEVGTFTYDASQDEMFQLYAVVLWTVSDYPGLAIASGHSTSSESGCFPCSDETFSIRLKNGQKYCFMGHRRFLHPDHEFRCRRGGTTDVIGWLKLGPDVRLRIRVRGRLREKER